MSEITEIAWCDSTFNPWEGCQKVGPGCDHCYAEARNARFAGGGSAAPNWGPGAPRRRTSASNWGEPAKWQRRAEAFYAEHGRRQRVFCSSLADVFDNAVPIEWLRDLCSLIELTPDLRWLLLTKRIGNVFERLIEARSHDWLAGRRNVSLGITVVNQTEADRDIPKLLATPARTRFLSIEPMLGPIDVVPYIHCDVGNAIDWVICGGESGPKARPMHPDWARSLRDQCAAAGVPFLFKQWGEWIGADQDECPWGPPASRWMWGDGIPFSYKGPAGSLPLMCRAGKARAGRLLDGVTHNDFPRTA